jgi:hypothetical protein
MTLSDVSDILLNTSKPAGSTVVEFEGFLSEEKIDFLLELMSGNLIFFEDKDIKLLTKLVGQGDLTAWTGVRLTCTLPAHRISLEDLRAFVKILHDSIIRIEPRIKN